MSDFKINNELNVSSLGELLNHGIKRVSIAIGVFDGVHRGHQLLLEKLVKMAEKNDSVPIAMTFYPHPRAILNPQSPPPLLISPAKRISLLHKYGMKAVVTLSFSKSFAEQSPNEFINSCLHSANLDICGLCVGSNWRFGAKGAGSVDLLLDMAQKEKFDFAAVEEYVMNGDIVSSTSIRRAIASGKLAEADDMLGRNYTLAGIVERGYQDATNKLEHPTANIDIQYGVMPPCGVYAGRAMIEGKLRTAAINIGTAPTFDRPGEKRIRLEAHFIDYDGDVYGKLIEVELLEYLREERCFRSPVELKAQIEQDLKRIDQVANNKKYGGA